MEHPIFSLSTRPDRRILEYSHNGIQVQVTPSVKGRAMIHDKDILIYCISQLMAALNAGREDLAQSAAQAVADLENESLTRQQTVDRLDMRILQLRQSIETANRRLIDLKQGALSARAVRREQGMQKRLNRHLGGDSPMDEAQELIAGVLQAQDPFEQSQILAEIDQGLDHTNIAARMEEAGFGEKNRSTAADVLGRLKD